MQGNSWELYSDSFQVSYLVFLWLQKNSNITHTVNTINVGSFLIFLTNANNWLIIIHNDIMLEVDGPPSSHFSVKGELNLAFKRFFLNTITHQCWFPYVGEWMSEELWVFSIDMRVKGKALRGTEISSPFTLRSYKWTPLAHTVILAPILNRSLAWTQCFFLSYKKNVFV